MRFLRAVMRTFSWAGWVVAPPSDPYNFGYVIPVPREPGLDQPRVPLSKREREIFRRLTAAE